MGNRDLFRSRLSMTSARSIWCPGLGSFLPVDTNIRTKASRAEFRFLELCRSSRQVVKKIRSDKTKRYGRDLRRIIAPTATPPTSAAQFHNPKLRATCSSSGLGCSRQQKRRSRRWWRRHPSRQKTLSPLRKTQGRGFPSAKSGSFLPGTRQATRTSHGRWWTARISVGKSLPTRDFQVIDISGSGFGPSRLPVK